MIADLNSVLRTMVEAARASNGTFPFVTGLVALDLDFPAVHRNRDTVTSRDIAH